MRDGAVRHVETYEVYLYDGGACLELVFDRIGKDIVPSADMRLPLVVAWQEGPGQRY